MTSDSTSKTTKTRSWSKLITSSCTLGLSCYILYKVYFNKPKTPKKGEKSKNDAIIGTHSGSFHCDEALACFMLQNHTKKYKNAKIIRSRDDDIDKNQNKKIKKIKKIKQIERIFVFFFFLNFMDILSQCDILVDVGKEFNPKKNLFDHHQRSFKNTFSNNYKKLNFIQNKKNKKCVKLLSYFHPFFILFFFDNV